MKGYLLLADGTRFEGELFGAQSATDGEVVFSTAMMGYEQSLTDPSFKGQILTFTYPMIGNYGIPSEERDEYGMKKYFEGEEISVRGVVVCEYSREFSHYRGEKSFSDWLADKGISGICGIDTRKLTQYLRDNGSQLGQIVPEHSDAKEFNQIEDPNTQNLVAQVSCTERKVYAPKNPIGKKVAVFDFGIKLNQIRLFLDRGIEVVQLPWDANITDGTEQFDGVFLSNGPGDPETIAPIVQKNILYALENNTPLWGICLGNQILALSVGGKTKKMPYGHRGVNQPCQEISTGKCIVTSQNHGYEVDGDSLPKGWKVSWKNLNDGSCEGITHESLKAFSVQFHPEASPGPKDAEFLFDEFINTL